MIIHVTEDKKKEDNTIRKEIQKRLQIMESLKQHIQGAIADSDKHAQDGRLTCRKVRGNYQYYIDSRYVSKITDMKRITGLAVAEYHKAILPLVEKQIRYLEAVLKVDERISSAYTGMNAGKRVLFEPDVVPVSKIIEDFEKETYDGLGFDENDKTEYYTVQGERVRSKSEKIIADELYRRGIPYKYEKPLILMIDGKTKMIHPDFTVLNIATGKVIYLEHLGMMDNQYYYNNTLNKLDAYEKNGLLIGRDIILLHESARQPLNTKVISDYIDEFLL